MTRAEKVLKAQELIASGLTQKQIAEQMGVRVQTVNGWLCDPFLLKAKARRARYSRPCEDCGVPTCGSGGFAKPRRFCRSCAKRHQHDERRWTAESIVEWIEEYVAENGCVPPATVQLKPGGPSTDIVRREFGTNGWRRAVSAAGLRPVFGMDHAGSGHGLGREHPLVKDTITLYESGLSTNQIAALHNVTQPAILDRLRCAGVKLRGREEGRQLRLKANRALAELTDGGQA